MFPKLESLIQFPEITVQWLRIIVLQCLMQAGKNGGFMYFTGKEKGNVPRSSTPALK